MNECPELSLAEESGYHVLDKNEWDSFMVQVLSFSCVPNIVQGACKISLNETKTSARLDLTF